MTQAAKLNDPRPAQGSSIDIKRDLETLRDDLKTLKEDIAALGKARAETARENLKDGITNAEAQTKEALEDAATELQEIQHQAERAIRKKPITAIASALAIGYFIASLRK